MPEYTIRPLNPDDSKWVAPIIGGTIFMQPGAPTEEEMYEQALTYIHAAPGVLFEMVSDLQTDATVEQFTQDWQKVNKE